MTPPLYIDTPTVIVLTYTYSLFSVHNRSWTMAVLRCLPLLAWLLRYTRTLLPLRSQQTNKPTHHHTIPSHTRHIYSFHRINISCWYILSPYSPHSYYPFLSSYYWPPLILDLPLTTIDLLLTPLHPPWSPLTLPQPSLNPLDPPIIPISLSIHRSW